ncbi:MAG: cupin domain-containing protein, partial [Chloroflexota bacterium]
MTTASPSTEPRVAGPAGPNASAYERWMERTGAPIYQAYYIDDLRTLKLGRWDARGCDAAFLELAGQQGVTGAYVIEVGPGQTTEPFKVAIDECAYVLQGRGITTIESMDGSARRNFEWEARSYFLLPGGHAYRISNVQGNQTARLLMCSHLPFVMSVLQKPAMFFNPPVLGPDDAFDGSGDYYSQAKTAPPAADSRASNLVGTLWRGNFFPDMGVWDQLAALPTRGAGGRAIWIEFPSSHMTAHMSVFPPRMYKKGHRHGPGVFIVIPKGEGYSIMWPEGGEKVFVPWHEGSCFVPPMRWFHQHFNVNNIANRYLAMLHCPRVMGNSETVEDRSRDQIEYPDEDPWVRETFAKE